MKPALILVLASLAVFAGCRKYEQFADNRVRPEDFLSDKKYKSLVVEIQYVEGHRPNDASVRRLNDMLQAHLNKPAGIAFQYHAIAAPGRSFYDISDIEKIEKQSRTQNVHGGTVAAYILFLDGTYARDEADAKVLGVAYGNSSVAIFGKTVDDYSGGLGQPSEDVLESTVLLHEIGHLLGLVDNGTSMVRDHQDYNHSPHCSNSSCLMYYKAENTGIIAQLTGNGVPALDQDCVNDLIANGGK